jgi:hypothetical protein
MDKKRKAYAPFSLTSEAGVAQTPVEGYIDVNQSIYPIVNTGVVNENGKWQGVKADDTEFRIFAADLAVGNGANIEVPTGPTDPDNFIDMTGFKDVFIAILPTRGGNVRIQAIMGQSTNFANLTPLNDGVPLVGNRAQATPSDLEALFDEDAISLEANKWNIYPIVSNLAGQKNLQFQITNNSGGNSDIQFAYMRLI